MKDHKKLWEAMIKKLKASGRHKAVLLSMENMQDLPEYQKKKKKVEKTISPDVAGITVYFHNTLPEQIKKNIKVKSWESTIDKLLKEYKYNDIVRVIKHFRLDPFWSKNFLSPLKLLKKNKDGIRYMDYFLNNIAEAVDVDKLNREMSFIRNNYDLTRECNADKKKRVEEIVELLR